MKKLLIQPCVLMIIALSTLAYGCKSEPGNKVNDTDLAVAIKTLSEESMSTQVSVSFTPEKGTASFAYAIGVAEDVDSFLDGTIPGYTLVKGGEPLDKTFEDLEPGAVYTVFARAYNANGDKFAPSELSVKTYTADFQVTEYYVTDVSAGFQVVNTADYYKYAYYLGQAGDLEAFRNDDVASTVVNDTYKYTYNYWELTPNTEYTFFVKGWDRANNETKIFTIDIKTAALGSDEIPNVEFTPGRADFYKQKYTVTPNAKCKQIVLRQSTKNYNNANIFNKFGYAGDVIAMFDSWKNSTNAMMTCFVARDQTLIAEAITPELALDAALDVYVIIYDENYEPVSAKKFMPKTPSKNLNAPIETMVVDITMTKTAQDGLGYTVNTNEDVRFYLMDIYNDKAFKKVFEASDYNPMTSFQKDLVGRPSSTVIEYDKRSAKWTNVEIVYPFGEKYHVVVCPTNENGPYHEGFGKVAIESFVITE